MKEEKYQIPQKELTKFNLNFGLKFTRNKIQTQEKYRKYKINESEVKRYKTYIQIKGSPESNKKTLNTIEKLTEVKLD